MALSTIETSSISGLGYGFKNRIINGAMVFDQRNAGNPASLTSSQTYFLDRWFAVEDTDGTMTIQQSLTAPAGFTNSTVLTTGTADASLGASQICYFAQKPEGYNVADLGWGTASAATVTLSFWVRSSLTGTFGGAIANNAFNRSYPFSYTISAANTFEYKTITIAGDTSGTWLNTNGVGMQIFLGLGVGSTFSGTAGAWAGAGYISATGATSVIGTAGATFFITGVQLEKGSTATSFDYRPYGTELALCQRYFEVWSNIGGSTGYMNFGSGGMSTTTVATFFYNFLVQKRTNPSFTYSSLSDFAVLYNGGSSPSTISTFTLFGSTPTTIEFQATTNIAITAYQYIQFAANNNITTSKLSFSAEL